MSTSVTAAYSLTALKIHEIFFSLQGETSSSGYPTTFIRLTGCPLRCSYCDTSYAFSGGTMMCIADILKAISAYQTQYITVTGGEPLAQQQCHLLLSALCDRYSHVSLETSGALCVAKVDPRVRKILDIKTPDSGESSKNRFSNLDHLQPQDEIKFVIGSHSDFLWSQSLIAADPRIQKANVLFSPIYEQVTLRELAEWVLAAGLQVRVQAQLHKMIWGEEPGR